MKYEDIEKQAGFKFFDLLRADTDPRYIRYKNWLTLSEVQKTLVNFRLLLYLEVRVFELFSGDGYTYNKEGVRGDKEYLTINKPLQHFKFHEVIQLDLNPLQLT